MNWKSYFWPQKISLGDSAFNKKIEVIDFLGRRSLRVNNLTQSGSIVEDIYKKALKEIDRSQKKIERVLILGMGAGTFVRLINKAYPGAKITGIEIDPKIIDIAKKFFDLDKIPNLTIKTQDAIEYVKHRSPAKKYDLIFVDLYRGEIGEVRVNSLKFLSELKKGLSSTGTVLFNRLNFKEHQKENSVFIQGLKKIFGFVREKKSYSNLLIFAAN